ncbi:MAG TPA: PAS domain-containing protein [Bryobacteraceae bacterium]|nr:PAS domain-containing protein [Bryobacteraceae bacterium]
MDADLLKAVLDCVSDGVCLVDAENRIVYWNHGAERITGFLAQETTGKPCLEQLGLRRDGKCSLSQLKDDGKPRECVEYIRHRQGHRVPVRLGTHTILDAQGQTLSVVEVFARASAQGRKELGQAARHSGHDSLTGAVNREYGEMRLVHELEVSRRFGLSTAWMRVDLACAASLERNFGRGMVDAAMQMAAHVIDANLDSLDCLTRWDPHGFRVMLRHAVESRIDELAARLHLLARESCLHWWGEDRSVELRIAYVMAGPGDTPESLEERVAQAIENGRSE